MTSTNSSNKVAILALVSLLPIFLFVIGNGWATILAPTLQVSGVPVVDHVFAYVAGFLLGIVAVLLAWAVASERARLPHDKTAKNAWLAYLVVLIALSALGTMNWLFKVSETPTFIKESLVETREKLQGLDQIAQKGIILTGTQTMKLDQEALKNRLNGLVTRFKGELDASRSQELVQQQKAKSDILALTDAFEAEVRNPLKAGCGEVAQGYLDQIKAQLPALRLPSGNCQDAEPDLVVQTYKQAIQKALANRFGAPDTACLISQQVKDIAAEIAAIIKVPPTALESGCPPMATVISDTEAAVAKYVASLPDFVPEEKGLVELRDVSSERLQAQIEKINAVYRDENSLQKSIAAPALKEAWSEYRAVYKDLTQAVDPAQLSALPANIDDQRIDKIGNISNTLEILLSRYDHLSTYPIIFAGILFDMILIAFFFRVEAVRANPKRASNGHEERLEKILSSIKDA